MLFHWMTTKYGKIWLDGEGFRQIISKKLPKEYYCQEVSFIGERSIMNIFITMPELDAEDEKAKISEQVNGIFVDSGITPNIDWIYVAPQDNPKATPVWSFPLFWGGAAAAVTALINMGIKGILWSLFIGIIGYGVSWIIITEDGQKQFSALIDRFRR
jgi:hypothetical protein